MSLESYMRIHEYCKIMSDMNKEELDKIKSQREAEARMNR